MAYVTKINGYDIKDSEARSDVSTLQESMTTAQGDIETLQGDLSDTKADLGNVTQLETTVKTSTVNAINEVNAKTPMINITWSALKALRDAGNLIRGLQYRITDFVTTTVQADTQSAGHAFDVIVVADSGSVLNENARAALHAEDTYFANSKLNAWKLKYCLDNDTTRFVWADTTNGKGVIYRMIDEFDNDLPYDFKNIQFKRYKANGHIYRSSISDERYNAISAQMKTLLNNGTVSTGSLPYYYQYVNSEHISGTWYDENGDSVDGSTLGTVNNFLFEPPSIVLGVTSDYKYFYTFSYMSGVDAEPADATIFYNIVYKNKFGWKKTSSGAFEIGANVFIGNYFNSNTVGDNFQNNTIGNNFQYNMVGNYFQYNTVGNNFNSSTVGNNFQHNMVGNYFQNNTVGNYYKWNHVEDGCSNLNFSTNGTSSSYVQKYRVLAGTAPSSAQTVSVTAGNTIPFNVKQTGANAISVSAA